MEYNNEQATNQIRKLVPEDGRQIILRRMR